LHNTQSQKGLFSLGPKSRVRRLVVGVRKTPPHQETTIISAKDTFTTIQKQSHPPVRIFASHQIKHTHTHRAANFSLATQKEASFLCANEEKKMKNLNESSAEEPNANGAFNRSLARSIQPILVRAKTNGFERERERIHVCACFARTFSYFF
jgi:hypothetical protein